MATNIYKGSLGWTARTHTEAAGQTWEISTYKSINGGYIVCNAQAGILTDNCFSYMMYQDKHITLIQQKANATEKAIREVHSAGLSKFSRMKQVGELGEEKKKIEVGQIIFLNGYGQDEYSHERKAIYKIEGSTAHTVNLDKLTRDRHDLRHIKNITEKFGIGTYYKEGDTATAEEIETALRETIKAEEQREKDERERQEEQARQTAAAIEKGREVISEIPRTAKCIIVANYMQDDSDIQTDYFASHSTKTVYLAWSSHDKNLFSEMRKAAENFEETQHLGVDKGIFDVIVTIGRDFYSNGSYYRQGGKSYWHNDQEKQFTTRKEAEEYIANTDLQPTIIHFDDKPVNFIFAITEKEIEHRENYSMGAGYYLGNKYSGWRIRKQGLPNLETLQIAAGENRFFVPANAPENETPTFEGDIQVNRNQAKNGIEIRFTAKPDRSTLENLKQHGYKWSHFNKVWYCNYSEIRWNFAQSLINIMAE